MRSALDEALGVRFEGTRDEAFFRSTLVQTLSAASSPPGYVYVLDLCCGTGAYLAEVLRRIAANLEGRGPGALAGAR